MSILDLQVISLLPRNNCLDNNGCYIFYCRNGESLSDKFIDGLLAYLSSERIGLEAMQQLLDLYKIRIYMGYSIGVITRFGSIDTCHIFKEENVI